MIRIVASIGIILALLASGAAPARAGGYEFPGDGARAIGRGGAFAARADDPMAVVVNPAALASLPGTQLMLSAHLLAAKDCFYRNAPGETPDGTPTPAAWDPGWGVDPNSSSADGSIDYTQVCNEKGSRLTAIPTIGVTWRISKRIGMGFAIIPPNSEMSQRWGGSSYDVPIAGTANTRTYNGYVDAPPGSTGTGRRGIVPLDNGQSLLPAPSRFLLVERSVLVVYPTIAVGAKPFRWFQFGAAFGWGIADVTFYTNLRNGLAGEDPNVLEGQSKLEGQDWFAPRVSAALHFIPHDNVDIVGVFRWDDAIRAKGSLDVAIPVFDDAAGAENTLKGTGTLVAPRPWWITFGVRYADRIVPRPDDPDAPGRESGKVEDPMLNERWDLEVNVVYEKSSVVDNFDIIIEDLDGNPSPLQQPINTTVLAGHKWQDQISLRVGGDWNVVPGAAAVRGGFSYETSGFTGIGTRTSKTGTIDFMPGQRFGLHLGFTARMGKVRRAELSGAFTYFWMTTHHNGNGGIEQIVVNPVNGGSQVPGYVVNNGAFSSRYVVGSVMFRYFFKGRFAR